MSSTTTAADLLTKRFLRISTEHTVSEMLSIILYGEQKKHDTGAIVLIDTEAEFAGILTHNTLMTALSPRTDVDHSNYDSNEAFFKAVDQRLHRRVTDFVSPDDWPSVRRNTPLAKLAKMASELDRECIPVIEEGRVEGLVYLTDIFAATAGIALTPETEGINLK